MPLQWMLGLRRLKLDAVWLELLPATQDARDDRAKIDNFQRQLREHGLAGRYCLLYQKPANDVHDVDAFRCIGISKRELLDRLAGPNTLLNLSYSIHPPLLLQFERRIFCDLDPSEIFYWMTRTEMGQSHHHEFWTIGLNVRGPDCRLPESRLKWKTFYPLVDTEFFRRQPRPRSSKFTTIGQWYWSGAVEVAGEFPDLSKKLAFEKYLDLPLHVPEARFELAMNINANDPERMRLAERRWHMVDPHRVARTPRRYRSYIGSALAEFTAIKGVDVRSGGELPSLGTASRHRRHRRRDVSSAGKRLPFCRQAGRSRRRNKRSPLGLAKVFKAGTAMCGGTFRFDEESL